MRLILSLILVSLVALSLGFGPWPPAVARTIVKYAGYPSILLALIGALVFGWRVWRAAQREPWGRLVARAWPEGVLVLVCSLFVWISQDALFRVTMDEPVLASTALSMHLDKTSMTASRGFTLNGDFHILGGYLDKRPLTWPFLVSLAHDLTGYRVTQPFWINAVLVPLFLGLLARVGWLLGGGRPGAWFAVLLMTGFPLFAFQANSGGAELLNLTLLLAVGLLAMRFVRQPDDAGMGLLVFAALLLAQVRYESVVYILPVGMAVVLGWIQARRIILPRALLLVPLLLVCVPLQNKVFRAYPEFWQYDNPELGAFSLDYLGTNLAAAWRFFSNWGVAQPNAPWLPFLLLVGLLLGRVFNATAGGHGNDEPSARVAGRRVRHSMEPPALRPAIATRGSTRQGLFKHVRTLFPGRRTLFAESQSPSGNTEGRYVAWTALAFMAMACVPFGLMLVYHWGDLDDIVATRIAWPFLALLILATVRVWRPVLQSAHLFRPWVPAALAVVCLWGYTRPVLAQTHFLERAYQAREIAVASAWIEANTDRDALVALPFHLVGLLHQRSSITPGDLQESGVDIAYHLRLRTFSDIIAILPHERLDPGVAGEGEWPDYLGDRLEGRELERFQIGPQRLLVVYRVTDIHLTPEERNELQQLSAMLADPEQAANERSGWAVLATRLP
ncbi:MAG: hypothetical protein ACFE0O_09180 [Opitutales bacterium]